jgi:dual specificity phosphatase 12
VLSAAEEKERPSSSPAAAVTHILSLISQEIDPLDFKRPASRDPRAAAPSSSSSSPNKNCKLKQKTVPLLDIHSQNLLDYLEDCLDFIESGRNSGGVVLVHCFAGVSRRQASINLLPPILHLCSSRRRRRR